MIKYIIWLTIFLISMFWSSYSYHDYVSKQIDSYDINMVRALLDEKTKLKTSIVENWQKAQTFENLLHKEWAISWINGWFFCPDEKKYSWCTANTTAMNRIYNWKLYSQYGKDTWEKWILWVDKNNKILFVQNHMWYIWGYDNNTNKNKFDNLQHGISMSILVDNWKNVWIKSSLVNDSKQQKKQDKTFICSVDKNIIYFWEVKKVTLKKIWDILVKLWCKYAIQLDSWWSKTIYYKWKYKAWPGRNIMDAYVLVDKDKQDIDIDYNTKKAIDNYMNKYFKNYENWKNKKEIKQKYLKVIKKINKIKTSNNIISYLKEKIAFRILSI